MRESFYLEGSEMSGSAKILLLALCSEYIPGSNWGTICSTGNQIRVIGVQGKYLSTFSTNALYCFSDPV